MFYRKWRVIMILWISLIVSCVVILGQVHPVAADGTEELGPPEGVTIATGSGVIAAGVGISDTIPATLVITVPTNSVVKQALLYWSGGMIGETLGEDTLIVDGQTIQGKAIGGPTWFFQKIYFSTHRADITALDLIKPGVNTLSIESQPYDGEKDGVGIMVIYDDLSGDTRLQIRDGVDMAYHGFNGVRQVAVPQTFAFPALSETRRSRISMFFGSVAPHEERSSLFQIKVDGRIALTATNLLGSHDGAQWDTINLDFDIPTGATEITVEVISPPDVIPNGASFSWIATGFFLLDPVPNIEIRKFTNGNDANDPNGSDVPQLEPNEAITWTYVVHNTGNITVTEEQVTVTDSQATIVPVLDRGSDDGDGLLSPGEQWTYVATGTALNLLFPPATITVVQGCSTDEGSRTTYKNIGTVTIPGATSSDPSHYCNPPLKRSTPTGLEEEAEPETWRSIYLPMIAQ